MPYWLVVPLGEDSGQTVAVGLATETDSALALVPAGASTVELGIATEADSGLPVTAIAGGGSGAVAITTNVRLVVPDLWAPGTTVGVWLARALPSQMGQPAGVAAEYATVDAEGNLDFLSLASGETYVAYYGGRQRLFTVPEDSGGVRLSLACVPGTTVLLEGVAGRRWRVKSYTLVADGDATFAFVAGFPMEFDEAGGAAATDEGGLVDMAPGADLIAIVTGDTVHGHLRAEAVRV